ncbi:MAG: 2Fe-2S iron-sulfur cluster-binding protein [Bacteroidales bacterium]|nr:2Fe-2S iron-sulfur cluster-binding protein [Bacteroidales bacterium]
MPVIEFENKKIHCPIGSQLREVLIKHGISPHNGNSNFINCRGLGSCGTCAMKITGDVSPMHSKERLRLSLPPHNHVRGLRLSCQIKVLGDIRVEKGKGYWGQIL